MAEAQRHTLGVGSQTLAGSDTTEVVAIDLVHRKGKQKYLKLKVTQRSRHTSHGSENPTVRGGTGGTKPRPWRYWENSLILRAFWRALGPRGAWT